MGTRGLIEATGDGGGGPGRSHSKTQPLRLSWCLVDARNPRYPAVPRYLLQLLGAGQRSLMARRWQVAATFPQPRNGQRYGAPEGKSRWTAAPDADTLPCF